MEGDGPNLCRRARSPAAARHSCAPEVVLDLLRRAQSGDVPAEHQLHVQLEPKLRGALAPYRRDEELYEDLVSQGYLILHRLIMEYNFDRGTNVFTYVDRKLASSIWSYVRQERTVERRTIALSQLLVCERGDDELSGEGAEEALERAVRKERGWLAQGSSVEEVVVLRMAVEEAARGLPTRQRKLYELLADGCTVQEMAAELGVKVSTAYKAIERLRERLRKALERGIVANVEK